MKNTLIIVAIVVVALIAGGYFYTNRNTASVTPVQTPVPTTGQTTEPTLRETTPITGNDELLAGGNSFLDKNNIYSLLYPNDYVQDMEGDTITRFYKRGATQQGQTEMYDGVIVTIQTEPLNGQTLETKVDAAIKQSTAGGMAELISPKAPITVNNQQGFTYKIKGLNDSTYITLQKNDNPQNAVTVVYAVMGPDQQTFQKQVEGMLSTLQILK